MTINDDKRQMFIDDLGYDGPISQLENDWLVSKVGAIGSTPDMWKAYLEGQGHSGSLSDMFGRWGYPLAPTTGTGSLWTPLDLNTKLLAWWDASTGVSLSGDQVTAWVDRKNGYSASQALSAARPLFSSTGPFLPSIYFDGTDDQLATPANPLGTGSSEIWAVVQQDAVPAEATFGSFILSYGGSLTTDRRVLERYPVSGVNRVRARIGNGSGEIVASEPTIDLSSRHVVRGRYNIAGGGVGVAADRSPLSTTVVTPAPGDIRLRIGSNVTASGGYFKGRMRDVIVTELLTNAEVDNLRAFLLSRRIL